MWIGYKLGGGTMQTSKHSHLLCPSPKILLQVSFTWIKIMIRSSHVWFARFTFILYIAVDEATVTAFLDNNGTLTELIPYQS